ncbi:unnamed protein product [Vitrella brassicaformis CCMP3155]|uniref:RNA-editing substrate-binding complex 6 protein domain-containing protein n=2 Tax=Vitrella brassicaformis TaxID=1169539 RepID=A0A0G4H0B3_VITBC|nr:unnamed protein product [Vitrella brassicaformis CCMP3155]|eukprot:CEM36722.1 unnamed protein product [Vitrella brassicaformis CCMP3155]
MVTYAVGKAGIRQEAFLDWMAERLLERLPELPPETLGVIVNAYARLDRFHSALFKAISERVVAGDVEELNPVSVTQLVNGYARVECFDAALFKALARRIHALLDHFSAQSLSNIVHGYARLKIQDVKLFVAVARVIPKRLGEFEPQAMAITAHAYAKLMIRSEILFHLLANEILNKLPLFTGQGLGLVLYSYARLHIANAKLISASLRFLKHQIDELSRLEILTIRHALRNLGVLDEALQSALEKRLAEMTPFQPFEALNEDLLQSLANRSEEEEDTLVRMEEGEGEADGWVERQPPLRQRKYAAAAAAGGGGGVGGEDASGEIPVVVSRSGGRKSSRRAAVEMPDPAEDDPSHTPSIVDMWRLGDSEFSRALDRPTPPSAIRTWAQQQQQQQGAAAQTTGDTDTPHPGPQPTQGSIMMDGMAGRKHRKRPQRLFGPADVKVHDSVGVGVGVGAKGLEEHPPPRVGPIGQEEEGYDDTTWEGGYEDVVGADMGVGGARGGVGGTDRGRGRKSARGRKVDGM